MRGTSCPWTLAYPSWSISFHIFWTNRFKMPLIFGGGTLRTSLCSVDVHVPFQSFQSSPKKLQLRIFHLIWLLKFLCPHFTEKRLLVQRFQLLLSNTLYYETSEYCLNAVFSVSSSTRSLLKTISDRVFVRFRYCVINDRFWVVRCFRCSGLGHKAAKCTAAVACGVCVGPHYIQSC